MDKVSEQKLDIVVSLALAAFSAYIYFTASGFPGEAGVFPKLVSAVTFILTIFQLIVSLFNAKRVLQQSKSAQVEKKAINKNLIITIIGIIAYLMLIFVVGYLIATTLYLAISIYLYGYHNKLNIAIITISMIVFLYILFVLLLRVNLPSGLLLGGF